MKIILHITNFDNLLLAARCARTVCAYDFVWPADGWTVYSYGEPCIATFSARRNKSSVTVRELPA